MAFAPTAKGLGPVRPVRAVVGPALHGGAGCHRRGGGGVAGKRAGSRPPVTRRMAILLVGGDKRDRWSSWYEETIPVADRLFDEHLGTLQREEETHDPH